MCKTDKGKQLESAGASHNANSPANVDGTFECSEQKTKYCHIGLRLVADQYPITGRSMAVSLPFFSNRKGTAAQTFHDKSGSGFTDAVKSETPPSPRKLYPIAADHGFRGDLTTANPLKMEPTTTVWQLTQSSAQWANDLLGRSFAIHLKRSKTYTVSGTGTLDCGKVKTGRSSKVATEKMAVQLWVYVRMKLNGKLGIYPIEDGLINGKAISQKTYDKRKRLKHESESHKEWKTMPLMPGVQKLHALIEEAGTSFKLAEVYCDGDRIYPS